MESNLLLKNISQADVFSGLTTQEIAVLAEQFEIINFGSRESAVDEGSQGKGFYIVLSGIFKVILPANNAQGSKSRLSALTLNTLMPGDCFGEYSLLDDQPVSASIIAEEDAKCLKINKENFLNILDRHPLIAKTVYRNLLNMLVARLRKHDKELDMFL